ncbi:hypothetical protein AVEN_131175-1 [Araneus ventricosus]|uniref:RNase H type-1 domain-containing protein n=1 Tax=Araneus ventricosus TaxID=182803 RepID=A0A4Y2MJW0_ARAVE|nr:hypothetical protein AVEN_131175-1 [Araneus ventricosus]
MNYFNSLFQAELAGINFAAGWPLERNIKIKVFSDSKSSIEAIRRPKVKSNFVLSAKDNLCNAKDLISIVWMKAHAGNPGNKLADHLAKITSSCGPYMSISAPYSYVLNLSEFSSRVLARSFNTCDHTFKGERKRTNTPGSALELAPKMGSFQRMLFLKDTAIVERLVESGCL